MSTEIQELLLKRHLDLKKNFRQQSHLLKDPELLPKDKERGLMLLATLEADLKKNTDYMNLHCPDKRFQEIING